MIRTLTLRGPALWALVAVLVLAVWVSTSPLLRKPASAAAPAFALAPIPAPTATPTPTPAPTPTPIPAEWRKIGSFPEPIGAVLASDGEIRAIGLGGVWASRDAGKTWLLRSFTTEEDRIPLFPGDPIQLGELSLEEYRALVARHPEWKKTHGWLFSVRVNLPFVAVSAGGKCYIFSGKNEISAPAIAGDVEAIAYDGQNIFLAAGLDLWQAKSPF